MAYEVTEQGVSAPVISEVGAVINYDALQYGVGGNGLYASPQHNKIVSFHQPAKSTQLFDFDRSTGVISNPITLPIESVEQRMITSGTFSPDGKYFYTAEFIDRDTISTQDIKENGTRLIRFDVSSHSETTIQNSKITIDSFSYWGSANLLQRAPDSNIYGTIGRILFRISSPDDPDLSNIVVTDSLISGRTTTVGFNFPSLVITPTAPVEQDSMMLPLDTSLCVGQQLALQVQAEGRQYLWQDGSTGRDYTVNAPGIYSVEVKKGNCTFRDTIKVLPYEVELILPNDTTICENQQLQLTPITNANQLTWQDGSTNPTYLVNQAGIYTVTASQQGCSKSDSVAVQQIVIELELPLDTTICEGTSIRLTIEAPDINKVIWNGITSTSIDLEQAGIYQVKLFKESCSKQFELAVQTEICETCKLVVPNVFSPNQDGINDELPFLTNCPLQFFHIQIADRWGSIVYESNTPQVTWDGKFKGQIVENGIYTVLVVYQFMDAKASLLLTLPVQLMR